MSTPREIIADAVGWYSGDTAAGQDFAETVIARLKREGFAIVPVEATEKMKQAGFDPFIAAHDPMFCKNEPCGPIWRAMLQAAEEGE